MEFQIIKNEQVEPGEIEDLREQVGWDRCEGTYGQILQNVHAYYSVRNRDASLIGFVSVLSDGVADAFLLDLMIHPAYQRSGLGKRLVRKVITDMKRSGMQCVQVTFGDELEPFYARCGFHIFKGGIIDFKHMQWDEELL
jgi:ribosomal protein S18 acetylase RimI-like enzyme